MVKHLRYTIFCATVSATMFSPLTWAQTELAPSETPTVPALPDYVNRLSFGGDIRLRLNHFNIGGTESSSEQLRARFGVKGKINESVTAHLRLATVIGASSNTGGNETLGDYWTKKPFNLDIASLSWQAAEPLILVGGKYANPFFAASRNELVFDSDVNFEGAALSYSQEFGTLKPFLALAHNILNDTGTSTTRPDVTFFGAQVGTGFNTETFGASIAVSSYTFNNIAGATARTASGGTSTNVFSTGARGNSTISTTSGTAPDTITTDRFQYEYNLLNAEAELTLKLADIPLTIYGAWVQNSAPGDGNEGLLGGIRIGRTKDPGTYSLDYNYRDLEADSTLGFLTESDFAGGGTNVRGHKIGAQYMVAPSTTLGLTTYLAQSNVTTTNAIYERYMIEVLGNF